MPPKGEPVVIGSAILAVLQVLVAGAALADMVGADWASFASLIVAALTAGWGVFTRGLVTPVGAVAAYTEPGAGPAAAAAGPGAAPIPPGAPVTITPEEPPSTVRGS